jgi:hypothetical protein
MIIYAANILLRSFGWAKRASTVGKKRGILFIVIGISYNSEQAIFRCTNLFGECTFKKNEKKNFG